VLGVDIGFGHSYPRHARAAVCRRRTPPVPAVLGLRTDRGVRLRLAFQCGFSGLCGPLVVLISHVCHPLGVYVLSGGDESSDDLSGKVDSSASRVRGSRCSMSGALCLGGER
jgi:hypothetical protein